MRTAEDAVFQLNSGIGQSGIGRVRMGFVESPALKVAMPKKLKRYVFDAGNSNTGVAGVVIAVRAFNRRSAVRLANDFLRKYQYEPLEIKVNKPGGSSGLVGVDWALFCVGPNLRKRDIDETTVLD